LSFPRAKIWVSAGNPNAIVFPDPVAAMPTMSCPLRTTGQLWDWIGDGFWKFAVAFRTSGGKPASLKVARGVNVSPGGAASRVMPSCSRRVAISESLMLAMVFAAL